MRDTLEGIVGMVKGLAVSSAICLATWLVIAGQPIDTVFR